MVENSVSQNIRIMVVDDDRIQIDLLRKQLGHFGYHQVRTFNLPEEALEEFTKDPGSCDLFFVNWQMPPSINGITLAARLKETRRDLFVILTTGDDINYARQQDSGKVIDLFLQRITPLEKLGQVMQEVTRRISRPPAKPQ